MATQNKSLQRAQATQYTNQVRSTLVTWLAQLSTGKGDMAIPSSAHAELFNWAISYLRSVVIFSKKQPVLKEFDPSSPKKKTYPPNIFDNIAATDPGSPPGHSGHEEVKAFYKQFYDDYYKTVASQFFFEKIYPNEEDKKMGLPLRETLVQQLPRSAGDASLREYIKKRIGWWLLEKCRQKNLATEFDRLAYKIKEMLKGDPKTFDNVDKSDNWRQDAWKLSGQPDKDLTGGDRASLFRQMCSNIGGIDAEKAMGAEQDVGIKTRIIQPLVSSVLKTVGEPMSVHEIRTIVAEKIGIVKNSPDDSIDTLTDHNSPKSSDDPSILPDECPETTIESCVANFIAMTEIDKDRDFFKTAIQLFQRGLGRKGDLAKRLVDVSKKSQATVYERLGKIDSLFEFPWNNDADKKLFSDEVVRQLEKMVSPTFIHKEDQIEEQR